MSKKVVNKKETIKRQNAKEVKSKSSFSVCSTILFLISIITALAGFYIYNLLTPPEVPKLDPNFWWGGYPMPAEPDLSIRPFKVEFTDVVVNDLKERLLHRRPFAPPLDGVGFAYGFNTNFLTQVLDYWQNKYNFRERENYFNSYDHFVTNVQGLDIHFIHVKPKVSDDYEVLPLLLLHGWPSSVRMFYEAIPMLVTPKADRKFAFELIVPSLPGFGFSQATTRPGLGTAEIAVIIHNLMTRLGLPHYYIHGEDWGHSVGANMATLYPGAVLGFHTSMPVVMHPAHGFYAVLGSIFPSLVVEPELQDRMLPLMDHVKFMIEEFGYMHLQATKPDTVGVALTDSPAGLAAYILEKFSTWTNPGYRKAVDGNLLAKFSLTHLLDNIMLYWVTNSITSSMRIYAESMNERQINMKMDQIPTLVPTWGIKFKHEIMFQPDAVLKKKFLNYLHTTAVDEGGHFAGMENPGLLVQDIYDAVLAFRRFHGGDRKPQPTTETTQKHNKPITVYDFTVKDIDGQDVSLSKFKGHPLIIVNVASQCGLTDTNYKQLNLLYDRYYSRGLRILAFPCNQFGGQEPGSRDELKKFLKERNVKFDVFGKINVNGEEADELWQFLKESQSGTLFDLVKWNFSKFIVDKNGVPVKRFAPTDDPISMESELIKYL